MRAKTKELKKNIKTILSVIAWLVCLTSGFIIILALFAIHDNKMQDYSNLYLTVAAFIPSLAYIICKRLKCTP